MKSTGVVRRIDELGRIVLPAEVRRVYNINPGSEIEISTLNDTIVLKKHESSCIFCTSKENLKMFKEKAVCAKCADELS